MSRTVRNRIHKYEEWEYTCCYTRTNIKSYSLYDTKKVNKEIARSIHRYYNKQYYQQTLPKWFRNKVNRVRRAKDRHEIYKNLNFIEYEEQCSKWNCKDNNSWAYW